MGDSVLFSLVEFIDQKRRSAIAVAAVSTALLLVSVLAPILQTHHASITAYIRSSYSDDRGMQIYDSPDAVTNSLSQMANDAGQAANTTQIKVLSGALSLAAGVTDFDRAIGQAAHDSVVFIIHGVAASVLAIAHVIRDSFSFTRHLTGTIFGSLSGLANVSALIRPPNHTPTPTITQMRIQQAAIIQSGTEGVTVAAETSSTGGACDNGEGNGGYPLAWCNAPMDTIATIPYTSEPINRECTSYAYWYFTSVEGYTSFKAWGNAKDWAATSNFPTHSMPAVGAIAVETTGVYGHVAIVQALPGQKYEGQVVPAGYVLVSEMNYDWQGHFRYSYSPLSKFSAYIYP